MAHHVLIPSTSAALVKAPKPAAIHAKSTSTNAPSRSATVSALQHPKAQVPAATRAHPEAKTAAVAARPSRPIPPATNAYSKTTSNTTKAPPLLTLLPRAASMQPVQRLQPTAIEKTSNIDKPSNHRLLKKHIISRSPSLELLPSRAKGPEKTARYSEVPYSDEDDGLIASDGGSPHRRRRRPRDSSEDESDTQGESFYLLLVFSFHQQCCR